MATTLTVANARELVRNRLVEANATYWQNEHIDRAIDEGAQALLDIAIGNMSMSDRLRRHGHPFLARYLERRAYTVGPDNYDHDVPSNLWYEIEFRVKGSPPFEAKWKEPHEDRYIRQWPGEFGPSGFENFWTIVPTGTAERKIRVYVDGLGPLSNATYSAELVFFRRYSALWNQSPPVTDTDIDQEYSEGIIAYAFGKLVTEQRSDNSALIAELMNYARRIGLPPKDPANPAPLPKRVP